MDSPELDDVIQFLSGTACFTDLGTSFVANAARHIAISYHRTGETLDATALAGQLWLVRRGAVATLSHNDGLLGHLGEGDFFGAGPGIGPQHRCDHAEMLEDTLLYNIPPPAYDQLCEASSAFCRRCREEGPQSAGPLSSDHAGAFALTHRIRHLLVKAPVTCASGVSIADAANLMNEHNISSLPVVARDKLLGIVTDRDLRSRAVAQRRSLDAPIDDIMTADPVTADIDSFTFEALLTMSRHNVHHLPVMDGLRIAGVITVTDLIRQQHAQPVFVTGEIHKAATSDQIATVHRRLPQLFIHLVGAGARATDIARVLTAVADTTVQRLLYLFHRDRGDSPVPYAWLAFGSQGREELSICSDQDNGLLLSDSYDERLHGEYFAAMAHYVCDGLAGCGYRYCPGDIMASNRQWRQPAHTWRRYFRRWIDEPEEKAVMFSSIFFDLRAVAGDNSLLTALQREIAEAASGNRIFLAHMAKNALTHKPPLGLFRNLVLETDKEHRNQLDLKHKGLIPITDIARQRALARGDVAVNTLERLNALAASGTASKRDVASLRDAYEFMAQLRVHHQARALRHGHAADNFIAPDQLSPLEKHHLKSVFKQVKTSQGAMAMDFTGGL